MMRAFVVLMILLLSLEVGAQEGIGNAAFARSMMKGLAEEDREAHPAPIPACVALRANGKICVMNRAEIEEDTWYGSIGKWWRSLSWSLQSSQPYGATSNTRNP
jgi:hypothetical protein